MNVLEKILEEIEDHAIEFESFGMCDDYVSVGWVKEIIRSHMVEAKDTNIHSNDDDYIMFTLNKDGVAEIYRDTYDIIIHCESIEEQKRMREILKRYKGWIPVEERLPEENGYYLVQLSRKLPNEDYSDRVVVLYNGEEKEFMCYAKLIIAWQPLPEPYKPKKTIPVAGMNHIMSRFTKVE